MRAGKTGEDVGSVKRSSAGPRAAQSRPRGWTGKPGHQLGKELGWDGGVPTAKAAPQALSRVETRPDGTRRRGLLVPSGVRLQVTRSQALTTGKGQPRGQAVTPGPPGSCRTTPRCPSSSPCSWRASPPPGPWPSSSCLSSWPRPPTGQSWLVSWRGCEGRCPGTLDPKGRRAGQRERGHQDCRSGGWDGGWAGAQRVGRDRVQRHQARWGGAEAAVELAQQGWGQGQRPHPLPDPQAHRTTMARASSAWSRWRVSWSRGKRRTSP